MKVALKQGLFVPVSISDIKDISTLATVFEVDSNYGRWTEDVRVKIAASSSAARDPVIRVYEGLAELAGARR